MVIDREKYKKLIGEYRALQSLHYKIRVENIKSMKPVMRAIENRQYEIWELLGFAPETNMSFISKSLRKFDCLYFGFPSYNRNYRRMENHPTPKLKGI